MQDKRVDASASILHQDRTAIDDMPFAVEASKDQLLAYLYGVLGHATGVMYLRAVDGGPYLLVSSAFADLVGRPVAQLVGSTTADLFGAGAASLQHAHDQMICADRQARVTTETVTDASGREHAVIIHKFPLAGPDGVVCAIGATSIDMTGLEGERRTEEAARHESEARFRAVFEHAPMGQMLTGMDGLITSVNGAMLGMLGYTRDEIVGHPAIEYFALEDRELLETEAVELLRGKRNHLSGARRMIHRDGHTVSAQLTSAVVVGEDGVSRRMVTMALDLTDEERARQELQTAHAAAIAAAERLRLLHAIATAANEAATLDDLAPRLLAIVCERLCWRGGALVVWPGGVARCVHAVGATLIPQQPPAGDEPELRKDATGLRVVVPLPALEGAARALVFAVPDTARDDWQPEVLRLIGGECARVIERETAARSQRDSDARFRSVFNSSPLAMGLTRGDDGTFTDVNDALCELLGRTHEDLIGNTFGSIVHAADQPMLDAAGAAEVASDADHSSVEMRLVHASGATVISHISLAWANGTDGKALLLVQIEDVTARRAAEIALRRQAERDALTGLANRPSLMSRMTAMADAGERCAALFLDLDGFKVINDTHGHDVGDEVLIEVAQRLRSVVRPCDLVVRFGGDEFLILCSDGGDRDAEDVFATAQRVAHRIDVSLQTPVATSAGAAHVTASIGIAGGDLAQCAPLEMLRQADTAMYQAKRMGKDRTAIYDADLHDQTIAYHHTELAIRKGLDDGRFVVYYQAIVDLADAGITGFEALVRLVDEDGKLLAPDSFIKVAEQSGLIIPLGTWVLRESCRTIAELRNETGRALTVSVNIAAQQVSRTDFVDIVHRALADAELPTSALMLELTESALLEADEATRVQLLELRSSGVRIGLDDFGTGYSSLSYLRHFPVSCVKVDRSFVDGMTTDAGDRTIVRAVTSMASELGLQWIAEGVETRDQSDALCALGRGFGQGYLYHRPSPADAVRALLRDDAKTISA